MIHDSNNKINKSTIKTVILIGFTLLIVLNFVRIINILCFIYGVVFPLLLGAGIAYILNILMVGYEKIYFPKSKKKMILKTRRSVCIVLSIFTIIFVLVFFLYIVIPQFTQSIRLLSAGFPTLYNNVVEWINQYASKIPVLQQKLEELNIDGAATLKRSLDLLGNWALGTASFIGTFFSGIVNLILAIIFSIYILFSKEIIIGQFDKLANTFMRADRRKKLNEIMGTANDAFSSFFVGQFKEAVILGLLCTLGMLIFRFPYATIIGPVIGLTALIPMVGAYLGAAVGFLLIVMVNPINALLFLVFVIVLQQVEGNVIYPKVVGKSIGLPGIWVFAAIIVGGGLMGIVGILLGVPVAATVYKLLSKSVNERLNQPLGK